MIMIENEIMPSPLSLRSWMFDVLFFSSGISICVLEMRLATC